MQEYSDRELLRIIAKRISEMAFAMPPPNMHTPGFVSLALAIEDECNRRDEEEFCAEPDLAPMMLSAPN